VRDTDATTAAAALALSPDFECPLAAVRTAALSSRRGAERHRFDDREPESWKRASNSRAITARRARVRASPRLTRCRSATARWPHRPGSATWTPASRSFPRARPARCERALDPRHELGPEPEDRGAGQGPLAAGPDHGHPAWQLPRDPHQRPPGQRDHRDIPDLAVQCRLPLRPQFEQDRPPERHLRAPAQPHARTTAGLPRVQPIGVLTNGCCCSTHLTKVAATRSRMRSRTRATATLNRAASTTTTCVRVSRGRVLLGVRAVQQLCARADGACTQLRREGARLPRRAA
jgi:hypothetical protein